MSLFNKGKFKLHSGQESNLLIDCDALTDADLKTLAFLARKLLGPFGAVEAIPKGGTRFGKALEKLINEFSETILIVDDVCTTGASLEKQRANRMRIKGVVIFERSPHSCPLWVTPLFILNGHAAFH